MRHCSVGRHAFGQPAASSAARRAEGLEAECSQPRGSASWQDAEIAVSARSCRPRRSAIESHAAVWIKRKAADNAPGFVSPRRCPPYSADHAGAGDVLQLFVLWQDRRR